MRQLAADVIIVKHGKILLIKRNNEPFKGMWALPGGMVEDDETVEEGAIREAKEETGIDVKLESLVGVFSKPDRDPRGIVAITFSGTVAGGEITENDEAQDIQWHEVTNLPELAADHGEMIKAYFGYD